MDLLVAVHSSGFPGTRSKETLKSQMHTPERKHKIMCIILLHDYALPPIKPSIHKGNNIKECCP